MAMLELDTKLESPPVAFRDTDDEDHSFKNIEDINEEEADCEDDQGYYFDDFYDEDSDDY